MQWNISIKVESYCHADRPDLHVPVAVLLHQLVPEVVKGCPGFLVRRLHRLLQAHSHDAVALEVELETKVHEVFTITLLLRLVESTY